MGRRGFSHAPPAFVRNRPNGGGWRSGLVLTALASVALLGCVVWYLTTLPAVDDAPQRVTALLAAHRGVPATTTPTRVATALVAVEDRRFRLHHGVDALGLVRAGWGTLTSGSPHGGATITEQLVEALYAPDKASLGGRVAVPGLALKLERRYGKDAILAMYMDAIYYGDGHWGIAQASRAYFGHPPEALTWGEASMLAGLPNAPSAYDPTRHYDLARRRQRQVLAALVQAGVLSAGEAADVYAAPPQVRGKARVGEPGSPAVSRPALPRPTAPRAAPVYAFAAALLFLMTSCAAAVSDWMAVWASCLPARTSPIGF